MQKRPVPLGFIAGISIVFSLYYFILIISYMTQGRFRPLRISEYIEVLIWIIVLISGIGLIKRKKWGKMLSIIAAIFLSYWAFRDLYWYGGENLWFLGPIFILIGVLWASYLLFSKKVKEYFNAEKEKPLK